MHNTPGDQSLNEEWARLNGWEFSESGWCGGPDYKWKSPGNDFYASPPNISGDWAVLGPELEKAKFFECYPEHNLWRGVVGRDPMCGCIGSTQLIALTRALIAWKKEQE